MGRMDDCIDRTDPSGAGLCHLSGIFKGTGTTGERLPGKGVLRKMRDGVNPSKFGKSPLPGSLSPEWRVWIIALIEQTNQEPPCAMSQADFKVVAPIWRKATR